ncbi:Sensor histidine kinase AruS [Nymphon striatum]|nr:Sensor histidine kinase AruS [Nymphon striatum]
MLMRLTLSTFALILAMGGGSAVIADEATPPLLTVTGDFAITDGGDNLVFDRAALMELPATTFETSTIWTEGVHVFTGVSLADLVAELGVESGQFLATAINDYTVEIPYEDAVEGGPIIAYLMDGEEMSLRDKGPLWVIYPYDSDADYRSESVTINLPKRARRGRTFALLAGCVALLSIALLTYNVSREIRLLGSARSDNVQWSLVQTQVEFLEFQRQVDVDPVDVGQLREEFDVFFSRVTTVRQASVFAGLRADPTAQQHLDGLVRFLDDAVDIIDAPDDQLIANLAQLSVLAADTAPIVRALGNSGLEIFAQSADDQRKEVARTMLQLAFAIAALIGVLTLAVLFLNRLNARIYRRERKINQTSTRMSTVMSTSLDGVIVCNANGEILEFSPAAEAIFGHKEPDVLGKDIGTVIVPDHMRDAHDAGMERMRMNGEKRVVGKGRVKLEAKRHDGSVFPVELAIQSASTDQGDIFIAFLRDISNRVAAEAELVAARDKALAGEKLKTDFLSTMSHEIRTPLNGLLGNMNLLRDTKLDSTQDRYVGYMETSGRLLMSHISDVLDITRYDAGKLSTRSEAVNLSALFQDIIDNQSSTAAQNETSLTWRWIGEEMEWVLSDHDRLQHVMMNLIGNAVKFTKRGKVAVTIENTGAHDDAKLMIKITDTGPGMTDDLAARIFDDFVTGNTAYDRDVGGTGLGLSIAKRFVTALGGEIGVNSEIGEGSVFWVELPVAAASAPEEIEESVQNYVPSRALSILLVEDNEINRIVAREMLQAEGHTVVEAHDGSQGVQAANEHAFDLILMDISMPVMDGRTATRLIRSEGGPSAGTTIAALTANAMANEQREFLADGMDEILRKPLSRDALRSLLRLCDDGLEAAGDSLIDHDHSAETREALGEETFTKLRSRFVSEVDELHTWVASEVPRDFLEVASRSHKVAGSAAVFGATELREALKALETSAKMGDTGAINDGIKEFADRVEHIACGGTCYGQSLALLEITNCGFCARADHTVNRAHIIAPLCQATLDRQSIHT